MITELIQITALLFSLSLRTANVEKMPYDYELMFGVNSKHSESSYFHERENGKYYHGYDIKYNLKYIRFTNYTRTAKNIDNQKLSLLYPYSKFKFGISYGTRKWENPQPFITVIWDSKYIDIDYSKGKNSENIEVDIKYDIKINKYLSLVPLIVIKKFNTETFYQTKIGIKYKI